MPRTVPLPVPTVSAVGLKLPVFWPGDPELWFAQVEAQFSTQRISDERTMYAHVVAPLSKEYAAEVRDLLLHPPTTAPYGTLKAALIHRTSESETSRLNQLLSAAQLGDRKPTRLLRHMERLVGNKAMDQSLFRQLFMQRLPRQVVLVLDSEATRGTVPLQMQAEIADKLLELDSGSHMAAVTTHPTNTPSSTAQSAAQSDIAALRAEIAALTHRLDQQDTRGRSSASDYGSRRGSWSNTPDRDIYFYDARYGAKARKCRSPCKFSGNGPARN